MVVMIKSDVKSFKVPLIEVVVAQWNRPEENPSAGKFEPTHPSMYSAVTVECCALYPCFVGVLCKFSVMYGRKLSTSVCNY